MRATYLVVFLLSIAHSLELSAEIPVVSNVWRAPSTLDPVNLREEYLAQRSQIVSPNNESFKLKPTLGKNDLVSRKSLGDLHKNRIKYDSPQGFLNSALNAD